MPEDSHESKFRDEQDDLSESASKIDTEQTDQEYGQKLVVSGKLERTTRSPHWQIKLWQLWQKIRWSRRRKQGTLLAQVAPLVDLFAAIVQSEKNLSPRQVDGVLDFLRYSFPEADHGWLARRFQRATQQTRPVVEVAEIAGGGLSEIQRMALMLEVLALLKDSGNESAIEFLLEEVGIGLHLPGAATHLRRILPDPSAEVPEPIELLRVSPELSADIVLPESDKQACFRILRCGELVLVLNDGEQSLRVRGRNLQPGLMLPLSSGQSVALSTAPMTHTEFVFFLNAKKTGAKNPLFLEVEKQTLIAHRTKQKTSLARVSFGLRCEIELLREANVLLGEMPLSVGKPVFATYNDSVLLQNIGPFFLEDLRKRSEDLGRRFYLDPRQRTVRVSNDPGKVERGDLILTPGLASPVLFEVTFSNKKGTLTIIKTTEPLRVNGKTVRGSAELSDGDLIRISLNQSLRCRFEAGVLDEERNVIRELSVEGLRHDFRGTGCVLNSIDFSIRRGEMACILGPSGSGKSTLLSVLAGHLKPTSGQVRLNRLSLYSWREKLTYLIAHLSREDVLNPLLSVKEHLNHAVAIRRPRLSRRERNRRTNAILRYLNLTRLASRLVGTSADKSLSDGERTRLNLGLDMAGVADVFLLDEPISGLSSKDSENVLETLKRISHDKIVICSLHRPGTPLLKLFDKVMLLDHGGQLAFWGTPVEMLRYFHKAALEMGIKVSVEAARARGADFVFEVLEAPQFWSDQQQSQGQQQDQRASFWQERFEVFRTMASLASRKEPMPDSGAPKASASKVPTALRALVSFIPFVRPGSDAAVPERRNKTFRQLIRLTTTYAIRTLLTRLRSRANLYTALLEGPILAILIGLTLRYSGPQEYSFQHAFHIPAYLFLSVIVAMFFGLTGAATEILRDQALLRRERNSGVFVPGYLIAKALVLALIVSIQSATYLLVGHSILDLHDLFVPHLIVMSLTALVGVSLSLLVSVIIKSERAALNAVPLLLVPQVLLAGALVPFEEMNQGFLIKTERFEEDSTKLKPGRVALLSELCPLRYSYESMLLLQVKENSFEKNRLRLQKNLETLKATPDDKISKDGLERTKLISQALTLMFSAEAGNADEARAGISKLRRAALYGEQKNIEKFIDDIENQQLVPGKKKLLPWSTFFLNDRLFGLYDLAEARRLKLESDAVAGLIPLDEATQHVFLSQYQRFLLSMPDSWKKSLLKDGEPWLRTRTEGFNHFILSGMTLCALLAVSRILHRSLNKC